MCLKLVTRWWEVFETFSAFLSFSNSYLSGPRSTARAMGRNKGFLLLLHDVVLGCNTGFYDLTTFMILIYSESVLFHLRPSCECVCVQNARSRAVNRIRISGGGGSGGGVRFPPFLSLRGRGREDKRSFALRGLKVFGYYARPMCAHCLPYTHVWYRLECR